MIHDMAGAIVEGVTGTYVVTRTARGRTVRGRYEGGTTSALSIDASVSPLSGEELLQNPELQSTSEVRQVITTSLLYVQTSAYDPDVIAIDGEPWEVVKVQDWTALGGFCVAFVAKKGRD